MSRRAACASLALAAAALDAAGAVPAIGTGYFHGAALHADGTVRTWGDDSSGQLGTGRLTFSATPVQVHGLGGVTRASAGGLYAVALKADGTVWSWGNNSCGQLGDGSVATRTLPVRVTGLTGITAVSGGGFHCPHTLALRNDGTVWGWGSNHSGELGNGASNVESHVPVKASGLANVIAVASGAAHSVALRSDGTVWTWGNNGYGQLGNGSTTGRTLPAQVVGVSGVSAIAAGDFHTVVLKSDGTLWAWGGNDEGALGDGTTVQRLSPVPVAGITGVAAISLRYGTVALKQDGTVWQWGNGALVPTMVTGLSAITAVAAGYQEALALKSDGSVWRWGSGAPPAQVLGLPPVASISGGVAVQDNGKVWTWGGNSFGELGIGGVTLRTTPIQVPDVTGVTALAAGSYSTVVLRGDGTVWAWGSGFTSSPSQVGGLANVAAISAGNGYALALKSDGTVWRVPGGQVAGLAGINAVSAGPFHSLALRNDGTVWAWGSNTAGQLGDGTTIDRANPVQVIGLTGVTAISAGDSHSVALRGDGSLLAWGLNGAGALGDGTNTHRLTPVPTVGIANVVAIGAGFSKTFAVKADGTVWGWGINTSGELGDGTTTTRTTPVQIVGLSGVVAVSSAGYYETSHSLARTANGSVWSWGQNTRGDLGDGTFVLRATPVVVVRDNAAGAIQTNDWFLDVDPAVPSTIPADKIPSFVAVASGGGGSLSAAINFRLEDYGKTVGTFVLGLVPPAFLQEVKLAPAMTASKVARLLKADGFLFVQLTPDGWTTVDNQLIAFTSGVINANGGSNNILDRIDPAKIPGAKFCIGYGESADLMLGLSRVREVLALPGATGTASGLPCVISGVYLSGPATSNGGTPVTFKATVVGIAPSGSVQFTDWLQSHGPVQSVVQQNEAIGSATLTTSSLAPGVRSIGGRYSGGGLNAPSDVATPLLHTVSPPLGGTTVAISGPSASSFGDAVAFTASVTGNQPTGGVQFRDNGVDVGSPMALFQGSASLVVDTLIVGAHSISAHYTGDPSNASSTSSAIPHTVHNAQPTTLALASSANPSISGVAVTFTAQVTGTAPTGYVVYRDSGIAFASAPLVNGSATLTVSGMAPGLHELTADYAGDASNPAATSNTLFQQVRAPAPGTTPVPFSFAAVSNVVPRLLVRSSAATITGISAPASIVVVGGAYSIGCTNAFTTAPGTVVNGQTVCVEHAAAAAFGATMQTTLTIGGVSATFASTTVAAGKFHDDVTSLVRLYYSAILGRTADAGGEAFWVSESKRVAALGANVSEALFALSLTFFTSAEYRGFGRDNAGYVTDLYETFFNRAPDAGGLLYWTGQIAAGLPRDVALTGFMFSAEFAAFTRTIFGAAAARAEVDTVVDFYRGLLGRLPDDSGFTFWVSRFRSAQCQGPEALFAQVEAISSTFAGSGEYLARGRNNTQYVGDLYNAFLRRGGDLGGVQYWIGQLDSGARTREQLRQAFVGSPEFNARAGAMVAQGCLQ